MSEAGRHMPDEILRFAQDDARFKLP